MYLLMPASLSEVVGTAQTFETAAARRAKEVNFMSDGLLFENATGR